MAETSWLKRLLKEPLVHFLGGALLVFAFFWATGTNRDPTDYTINIDRSDIERLQANWTQNFRRPPSAEELNGLVDQEITEEIYYREALRLGLDRGDPVIRRRLFTKMRFLGNQEVNDPTNAELQKWMEGNPGKYALSSAYDLQQVYLGQIGAMAETDIAAAAEQLNNGSAKPANLSEPISLPLALKAAGTQAIARQFGERFVQALAPLKTGKWVGPIPSGFGQHLVKVDKRIPGKPAALEDVRQAVTNDWRAAQTADQEKKSLDNLRSQYEIRVAGRE